MQVQSNGTLHLDLLQRPVRALDRTIAQVRKDLLAQYGKYIRDPVLTVSFKQSNVKIAELKQAITTSPRGQSRLVPIAPDGTISLPFVVDVPAAGRTVGQLHRQLNEAYRKISLGELEVTVNLQAVAPLRVYVLGEVKNPGVVLNRSGTESDLVQMTLLQALAQSGSPLRGRAELSKVALIRRRNLPTPQATIVNVYQLLVNQTKLLKGGVIPADAGKLRYDIWLEDGDIIYVPTTEIAKRADYIEYVWTRGIRAVAGSSSDFSVTTRIE